MLALQLEIQYFKDQGGATSADHGYDADSAQFLERDYHVEVFDRDDCISPPPIAYLGPGNSARLLERLLKSTVHWHIANNIQMPKRLLPNEPSQLIELQEFKTTQSFSMTYDQRKLELHSLLPPSIQRAIIEHYLKTVSTEFTLLPAERESTLLMHENPLRWSSSNKNDPCAFATSIVFAISSALVARDLDPNLSSISMLCREDVRKISLRVESPGDPIETTRWTCTALCALALCELISPTSGQLWDLLGRAASTIEDLREGCQFRYPSLDGDFRRLEHSLLKLERYFFKSTLG